MKHWKQMYGFKLQDLPYYNEASEAEGQLFERRMMNEVGRVFDDYPEMFDWKLKYYFAESRSNLLSSNKESISEALSSDNEEFFIELGKYLTKRKRGTLTTHAQISFEGGCQILVNTFWATGLLWLMTDIAALEFFTKVLEKSVTLDAYKAAYGRSGFFKHPDLPIIGIEVRKKSASERQAETSLITEADRSSCSLKLRDGWAFAENTLRQTSR